MKNATCLPIRLLLCFLLLSHISNAQTWTAGTVAAYQQWALWGTDASNVWMSGNGGTLHKWNGTQWVDQSISGITGQRLGLWGSSNSNVYSVGGTTGQQIARFNGTSWSIVTDANTAWGSGSARSVWGSSASDVWVTGGTGRALRYNGTSWTMTSSGLSGTLSGQAIWGLDASNVWLGGSTGGNGTGIIYKWNPSNSTWVAQTSTGFTAIKAIWGSSATDVWAVGGDGVSTGGKIYHFDGTTWTDVTPAAAMGSLNGIWGQNASNIWVVGDGGTVRKWNGTTWEAQTVTPENRLTAVFGGGSSSNMWIAADATSNNIYSSSQPLPLKLISFRAKATEQQITLHWSTTEESNTDKFEIEVANDDLVFRKIDITPTTGNGLQVINAYRYEFKNPEKGLNYYFRLKMIDLDQTFAYSTKVHARIKGESNDFFYPNPAANQLYLSGQESSKLARLEFIDVTGKRRLSYHENLNNTISLNPLPSGHYLVKMIGQDGAVRTKKLVIEK